MSTTSRKRDISKVSRASPLSHTRSAQQKRQSIDDQEPKNVKRQMLEAFKVESNRETDIHKIEARLKQISYGKNTKGYDRYIAAVPKNKRGGYDQHPRTPDPYDKVSKRMFDGRIRSWRRALHQWDDPNEEPIQVPTKATTAEAETPASHSHHELDDEVAELLGNGMSNSKLLESILTGNDIDSEDDVL